MTSISSNLLSLNAQGRVGAAGNSLATSMERLSSGMRINSAKDDAAGLAISDRMNSQIRFRNRATSCSACASLRCSLPTTPTRHQTA